MKDRERRTEGEGQNPKDATQERTERVTPSQKQHTHNQV